MEIAMRSSFLVAGAAVLGFAVGIYLPSSGFLQSILTPCHYPSGTKSVVMAKPVELEKSIDAFLTWNKNIQADSASGQTPQLRITYIEDPILRCVEHEAGSQNCKVFVFSFYPSQGARSPVCYKSTGSGDFAVYEKSCPPPVR
jgi:hypothetical protein